jgi:hypothetical protein
MLFEIYENVYVNPFFVESISYDYEPIPGYYYVVVVISGQRLILAESKRKGKIEEILKTIINNYETALKMFVEIKTGRYKFANTVVSLPDLRRFRRHKLHNVSDEDIDIEEDLNDDDSLMF